MNIKFGKLHLGLVVLASFFSVSDMCAQEAPYGSLGLRRIYQSTLINPVLIPDSTAVENSLSFIPFVPASPFDQGYKIEVGSMKLKDVTSAINNGTLDINAVVNNMHNSKYSDLYINNNISLFHAYFKVGKKGSRIEVSQRLKSTINTNILNKRTFDVLLGNSEEQTVVDLTDTRMQSMAWNEIALGYTTKINKKLTIGAKLKFLSGVAYADFKSRHLVATIGPDGNNFDVDSELRTASLNPITDKAYNQDLTPYKSNDELGLVTRGLTKNLGGAIDFGVGYEIAKGLRAFAGFNDLGFISWKNNPLTYNNKVVLKDFYPIKYNSETDKYETDFTQFTDSGVVKASSYNVYLNTHLNAGTTWQLSKTFHTTALLDAYVIDGGIAYPGGTLAGTLNGGRFFEFTMNAGYNQNRPFRVGTGMSVKAGPLQMHMFSNNIAGAINAENLQSVDVQFGLSWAWAKKVNKAMSANKMKNKKAVAINN